MDEKKLTDEEIIKAFKRCGEGSANACQKCAYRTTQTRCKMKKLHSDILDLIHRLQTELDTKQCIIRLLEQDVADRDKQLESKVEEVYADFMKDYKIMRDELSECYDEFGKLQAEMEETIDKQKAEIERLTEERKTTNKHDLMYWFNAYKECNEDCEKYAIENAELQKQVDELKELNAKYLDSIESVQVGRCRLRCELTEQAVKDTAKEIFAEWENNLDDYIDFADFIDKMKARYGVEVE